MTLNVDMKVDKRINAKEMGFPPWPHTKIISSTNVRTRERTIKTKHREQKNTFSDEQQV